MAREAVSVNSVDASTVRPSRVIQALAILTTAYLGVAAYYAVASGVTNLDFTLAVSFIATLAFVALASQVRWRFGAVLALILSFIVQMAWAGWIAPELIGYDQDLLTLAREIAAKLRDGRLELALIYQSSSPSATMVYAMAIAMFGGDLTFLSAGLWTAQAWLVWRICEEVSELRARSFVAVMLFALAPAVLVFGALPSVEAVFGLFALLSIWLVLSHRKRGLGASAALSGFFGALAFLAHPAGLGYVAGLIVVLLVGLSWEKRWPGRWRMSVAVFACLAGFGLGVAPQALLNKAVDGRWSMAPGMAIGQELFYGTDITYGGDVGPSDKAAEITRGLPLRIADRDLRAIAYEQISNDPNTFFLFAMTTKMEKIWGYERALLSPSRNAPNRSPEEFDSTVIGAAAPSLIDGVYLAIVLLAVGGALRLTIRGGAVRDPTRWVLVLVAVLCLATAHLFLRAHPRAHLAFTPLLVLLAPVAVSRMPRVVTVRQERREREAALEARKAEAEKAFDLAEIHRPKPVDPDIARRPAAERLANALKGMSPPPRPEDAEDGETRGDGPSAAPPHKRDASA